MSPVQFLASLLATAIIVLGTAYLLPGFEVESFVTAIVVALVLGVLNALVKPILTLLTLPITVFTLGLFSLVNSSLILLLTAFIVPGFSIEPFWIAFPAALIIAVFSTVASSFS